jgi:hypothetical protein
MAFELDAKHIPHLTLEPIGSRPNLRSRGYRRIFALQWRLDTYIRISLEGNQMVNDREVTGRLAFPVVTRTLINSGQIKQASGRAG